MKLEFLDSSDVLYSNLVSKRRYLLNLHSVRSMDSRPRERVLLEMFSFYGSLLNFK